MVTERSIPLVSMYWLFFDQRSLPPRISCATALPFCLLWGSIRAAVLPSYRKHAAVAHGKRPFMTASASGPPARSSISLYGVNHPPRQKTSDYIICENEHF